MAYAAGVSVALLVIHVITFKILALARKKPLIGNGITEDESRTWFRKHVGQLGGGRIFAFMGFRLVVAVALTVLSFVSLATTSGRDDEARTNISLVVISVRFSISISVSLFDLTYRLTLCFCRYFRC